MSKAPILVADIGGTHARFAYAQAYADRPGHAMTLKVAEFDTPLSAAQRYLTQLSETLGQQYQAPRQAAFAVAASVLGDTVSFTNSHWKFSCAELQQSLELERFFALNDFEALAYALPQLSPSQVRVWGDHSLNRTGNLAVLGPGTGLGVAALVKTRAGWQALPAEGGHASLAPNDDFESEVLRLLRKVYGHVSAERLLSGLGLPLLHQSILQVRGHEAPEITTEHLIRDGLESDPKAMETLGLFCAWLGGFAGNVALTYGAQGGVYIGGGIVPRLGDFFFASKFRERFQAKGRFASYLEKIPVAVIYDSEAALLGAMQGLHSQH
jgi:glucokinase